MKVVPFSLWILFVKRGFEVALILSMVLVIRDFAARFSKAGDGPHAVAYFGVMFVAYMVIAIWLARIVARWIGEKASHLFWPATTLVPPPLYYLIELYQERGDWERVLFECEKIIRYHPAETRAHLGRLEALAVLKRPAADIERIYRKSFHTLRPDEDRLSLNAAYEKILQEKGA